MPGPGSRLAWLCFGILPWVISWLTTAMKTTDGEAKPDPLPHRILGLPGHFFSFSLLAIFFSLCTAF